MYRENSEQSIISEKYSVKVHSSYTSQDTVKLSSEIKNKVTLITNVIRKKKIKEEN